LILDLDSPFDFSGFGHFPVTRIVKLRDKKMESSFHLNGMKKR